MDKELFKNEEKAIFTLRALYKQYGYLPFKMSKFEEYDLYVQNKDFLVSDRVITFNDTNGKLLALKPDVTLSIIKNTAFEQGCKQKVYYNENVYRVSPSTHQFKEIMQTGLECIGDIDLYDIFEAVYLGAKSLACVSEDFSLDLSDMAIFSAILDSASDNEMFKKEITRLISEKNRHEAVALCQKYALDESSTNALVSLIGMYGEMSKVLKMLAPICQGEKAKAAYDRLSTLCTLLMNTEYASKIKLDFSVVNDMNYYNGIAFKGFLNGIPEGVLSGGEYGTLMMRMGKKSNAIGFALYLDTLESLDKGTRDYDVDTLLIYDDKTDTSLVIETKNTIIAQGKSVSAQKAIPQKLRYKELIDLTEGK